jgi:hypothetical protein
MSFFEDSTEKIGCFFRNFQPRYASKRQDMVHFVGEEELIIIREGSENLASSRFFSKRHFGSATGARKNSSKNLKHLIFHKHPLG